VERRSELNTGWELWSERRRPLFRFSMCLPCSHCFLLLASRSIQQSILQRMGYRMHEEQCYIQALQASPGRGGLERREQLAATTETSSLNARAVGVQYVGWSRLLAPHTSPIRCCQSKPNQPLGPLLDGRLFAGHRLAHTLVAVEQDLRHQSGVEEEACARKVAVFG